MMTCEAIKRYTTKILLDDDGEVIENDNTDLNTDADAELGTDDAGAALWAEAEDMAANLGIDPITALHRIQATPGGRAATRAYSAQQSARSYAAAHAGNRHVSISHGPRETLRPDHAALDDRPDQRIDELARQHMKATGEQSYSRAVQHVLSESRSLRQSYQQFRTHVR